MAQMTYDVEPWALRESALDLDALPQSESVFALSNGHLGMRGNLDEGEPHALPGTYLNGVYELRPLPYAEAGYGFPESGQTVINVTNGKLIRMLVDDEPFDVRYGRLRSHERVLDFRTGLLTRTAEWTSPADRTIRMRSERLASLSQRAVAAIAYEVEAVDGPTRIVLQSELIANEQLPQRRDDPRTAAVLERPLTPEQHGTHELMADLVHRTEGSGLRMAAAMDHVVECPSGEVDISTTTESFPNFARVTVSARLEPGQRLRMVKFLAYGWSGRRSLPGVRGQVAAALTAAMATGWDNLLEEQRAYLDDFWDTADVEVGGDTRIQQAVRFALFHVLQAGARAEERAIPAKGLTGPGYDGHSFWDAEVYVLPLLTYTMPSVTEAALRWRHSTLDQARERAQQLGLAGAAFPWRTIGGAECSAYWPAGTAAFHIGAGVAHAVSHYVGICGDAEFEREVGVDLLVQTARLWRSLGHHDPRGHFRIDGVTGPDEYSAVADNNLYTNLMAQQNLRQAADACARHPAAGHALEVDDEEMASWRDAADAMVIPYDAELGVHQQAEGYTGHQQWDFENTAPDQYPLMLNFPYFDLYRRQVVKQADLVLAMYLRGDAFTDEEKARNFAYYEQITVRDSSLSACIQSVMAAEVGHLDLAFEYLVEAALVDLDNLESNTGDGLHMASLAGSWMALVAGFGGLRDGDTLRFRPRLPSGLARLAFRLSYRGCRLLVEVQSGSATYTLLRGEGCTLDHHGESVELAPGQPVTRRIPRVRKLARPHQPPGRAPGRRKAVKTISR